MHCKVVNHTKNAKQFFPKESLIHPYYVLFHFVYIISTFYSYIAYYYKQKYWLYPKLHGKMKKRFAIPKKKKKRFSLRRAKLATLGIFIVKWISHDISDTVIFKKFVPFTDCIKEINDEQVDNEKDLDIVMPIWNFVEYSGNRSKTSTISRSESFKYKAKQQEELLMLVIQVH